MNTKKIRKAHLSADEDTTWVRAFEYYKGMGLTDSRADKRAWNDTKFEHPRLRGFDGCYPKVRGK